MSIPATVHVFTYKQGLLSRLAHDLRLVARGFVIDLRGAAVTARFSADSLRVEGVMRDRMLDTTVLSASDRARIEQTMREEILDTAHHREVLVEGAVSVLGGGRFGFEGQLQLLGVDRSITMSLFRRGDGIEGELVLEPSKWGIRPYRALGGALKLQDRVRVRVELPVPREAGLDDVGGLELRWTG